MGAAALELLGVMAGVLVDEAAAGVELIEGTAGTVVVIVTVEEADMTVSLADEAGMIDF